ncbi:hypothetical protein ACJRO7_023574 [Eucalyptus globulus]|uniref:Uncharacterized protein n=1 Tax=Eucalyptus globulus TaxID=34317 RepID=A0ABD3K5R5_EUCGL
MKRQQTLYSDSMSRDHSRRYSNITERIQTAKSKKEKEKEKERMDKTRNAILRKIHSSRGGRAAAGSIAGLEPLEPLAELLDADDEVGDGVEEPVEDEGDGYEEI